ncbi:transporter [Polymorphobacter sp.]|uniref:transporter n=1 Tax=Polymorphobacter sp. TaxID=1909290 RepID=UPI003F713979
MRATVPALMLMAAPVSAQTVPTASTAESAICTDRPTKSNFACTVPKGMVQIETDLFSWQTSQSEDGQGGGERADVLVFSNPTLKFGLSDSSDLQFNWSPYARARSRDAAGRVSINQGIGDLTVRYKQRLTAPEGPFQLALLPFIKLPTAPSSIGNGKVEGGIALPVNYSIDGGWTVTLGPQLDVRADSDGDGHHVGVTGLVNLAKQFGPFTLYNEIWTSQAFDPSGTVRQWSYDVALAWLPTPNWQFDAGANIGLNRTTPDLVSYIGISTRF